MPDNFFHDRFGYKTVSKTVRQIKREPFARISFRLLDLFEHQLQAPDGQLVFVLFSENVTLKPVEPETKKHKSKRIRNIRVKFP